MLHHSSSVEFAERQHGLLNSCGYMESKSNHGSASRFITVSRRDCLSPPHLLLMSDHDTLGSFGKSTLSCFAWASPLVFAHET